MAGRRPKPTALKETLGNPGKRALRKNEPQPAGIPDCPAHLDAIAQQEWARISVELVQCGLLTSVDRAALAAYCMAYSRWVKAEENLRAVGEVVKTSNGNPIQNPYLSIANKAMELMHKFLGEFGMTPSARSRVTSAQGPNLNPGARQKAEDPADKYFAQPVVSGSKRVQ